MSFAYLEDFAAPPPAAEPITPPQEKIDPMQGYETGFQAGWDDAMASVAKEEGHISAEFARNLQELSFSFHEARSQVTNSLKPLISALITTLLPLSADRALAENVWKIIEPVLQDNNSPKVKLFCAPDDTDIFSEFTTHAPALQIDIQPEPTLHAGQAKFELAAEKHEVDIAALCQTILELIAQQGSVLHPETENES